MNCLLRNISANEHLGRCIVIFLIAMTKQKQLVEGRVSLACSMRLQSIRIGTQSQKQLLTFCLCWIRKPRVDRKWKQAVKPQRPQLHFQQKCILKVPQSFKMVFLPGNQTFKSMRQWEMFYIQTPPNMCLPIAFPPFFPPSLPFPLLSSLFSCLTGDRKYCFAFAG